MKCLLCTINNANATGSHLVPAWMLEPIVGPRDSEKSFSLDLQAATVEEYYGRNRLDNPSTEIKQNPQVYDHIFCEHCEDWLGHLESEVAPFLQVKIYEERFSSQFKATRLKDGSILKLCEQFSPTLLDLFFYSVIWRMSLKHVFESGASQFHPQIEQSMRRTISSALWKPIKDLKSTTVRLPYKYTIITSVGIPEKSATAASIDPETDNPTAFFLGDFIVLVHCKDALRSTGKGVQFSSDVTAESAANHDPDVQTKIVFVDPEVWVEANQYWINKSLEKWMKNSIETIAISKRIGPVQAYNHLMETAKKIAADQGVLQAHALSLALKQIIS